MLMNIILLILLCAAEAVLAVLSVKRRTDKKRWQTERLICSAGQLGVFVVMLLAPSIDMSFRFKGLFILLLLRIAVAFIAWFIVRNKEPTPKRTSAKVWSAVLSVLLISGSLVPSFLFTSYSGLPVTGEYSVASAKAILTDESRSEEFETDGSKREVPIYFFYPDNAAEGEKFPLVLFSHGAFGYYESNYSTYEELASNGYVVISTEHPYHSMFTEDTSGKTITVSPEFMNGMAIVNADGTSEKTIFELSSEWLKLRCDDINFVLDSVKSVSGELPEYWHTDEKANILSALSMADIEKIGVMGHSLGGAAAVTVGRLRNDVSAVIDLDGSMNGEIIGVENEINIVRSEPYPVPLLAVDNEEHHFSSVECKEKGIPYVNNVVCDNALCCYRTYFAGTGHMNFTDLPLFSPPLAKMLGTGSVDAEKCMLTVNKMTREFFDSYLKGKGEFVVSECTAVS